MRKKQYILTIDTREQPCTSEFEAAVKNAVLLALLEPKFITQWQYEQCCTKLRISSESKTSL